ncbi:hypothetical protein ZWY2020_014396 [Hordeum vulgare]|nr:hypothetical protein ZWY2020_014396 [Hordeum vulgare]
MEVRERRRYKGGAMRRPKQELAGSGQRRTGVGDIGIRRCKVSTKTTKWQRKNSKP